MATVDQTINSWDFKQKHVDPNALSNEGSAANGQGNFISAESCVVIVGNPTYDAGTLYPVGLVESFQVAQNKQINQIFEIGSRESYMIPGRTMTQLALSRVMFNGDSLLAALYHLSGPELKTDPRAKNGMKRLEIDKSGTAIDQSGAMIYSLASDLFNIPFGLGLYMNDSENETATVIYCENCMVQSHQLAMQAQNLIILENVSIRCTAVKTVSPEA